MWQIQDGKIGMNWRIRGRMESICKSCSGNLQIIARLRLVATNPGTLVMIDEWKTKCPPTGELEGASVS